MKRSHLARREPESSLATHIILLVFAATFLSAAAVSWISIETARHQLWSHLRSAYPTLLARSSERLQRVLVEGRIATVELVGTPKRQEAMTAAAALPEGERAPALARLTAATLGRSPGLVGFALLSPDGALLAQAGPVPSLSPELRAGLVQSGAAVFHAAETEAGPVFATAVPIPPSEGSGSPAHVVGVYDVGLLRRILGSDRPDLARITRLLDRHGHVLVRADAEGHAPGTRGDPPAGGAAPAPPAPGVVSDYTDVQGRHVIGAAHAIPALGWTLVMEEPYAVALAPVLRMVRRLVVLDVSVVALASLVAFLLTARIVRPIEELAERARRIAEGGIDEPLPGTGRADELGLLARAFAETVGRLRESRAELETANRRLRDQNLSLQASNEILEQLSITDGLTRLHNHRFFQDHLAREIKRSDRTGEPLAMLLIDIDDFKRLNDRLGHAAGDEILRRVACVLAECIRDSDLLARYGGEEFVIVASGTDLAGATVLAEKVRSEVAAHPFLLDDAVRPVPVTVSVGVSLYKGDRKRFFRSADRALYRAKASGKDCVRSGD